MCVCVWKVEGGTWYVDAGTAVEIVGEEVGVERGAHQNDLQVAPLHHQVF